MEQDYISKVKDLHRQILKKQMILHCLKKCQVSTQFENRSEEVLLLHKFPDMNVILDSIRDGDLDEINPYDIICREMSSFNDWVMEINNSQGQIFSNNLTSELNHLKDKTKLISKALTSHETAKEETSRLIRNCRDQTAEIMEKKASLLPSAECENSIKEKLDENRVSEKLSMDAMEKLIQEKKHLKSELRQYKIHKEEYEKILSDYTKILKEI